MSGIPHVAHNSVLRVSIVMARSLWLACDGGGNANEPQWPIEPQLCHLIGLEVVFGGIWLLV